VWRAGVRHLFSLCFPSEGSAPAPWSCGLKEFARRTNGSSRVLKEAFFERLFDGLELQAVAAPDVVAAQHDIKALNITQLLFIRCKNFEFAAKDGAQSAHMNFLDTIDKMIHLTVCAEVPGTQDLSEQERKRIGAKLILAIGFAVMEHRNQVAVAVHESHPLVFIDVKTAGIRDASRGDEPVTCLREARPGVITNELMWHERVCQPGAATPDAREFGSFDLSVGQVLQGAEAHRLGGEDSNVSVSAILKESPPRDRLKTVPS
jgi:hypothetical protein